jgi:DNA-binding transcriptional LysR family regulator
VDLNDVDLNKLRTFGVVRESGGVTAAARRLAVTRSAVSQALSGLERSLGVKLFHRVGKRLVPTREGELLGEHFGAVQARLEEAIEEVVHRQHEVRGLVRLGLFLGFPRTMLASFVARTVEQHPKLRVQISYGSHDELRDRLLRNRLDFVLAFRPNPEPRSKIRQTPLFTQELVLVAGSRRFRHDFAPRHLSTTPVIDYYRSEPLIDAWARHHYGKSAPRPEVVVWAATTDLVLELVLANAGVGVVPRPLAEPYIRRRKLHLIASGRRELRDTIWLHELADASASHTLTTLREALLKDLDPGDPGRRPAA